MSLREEHLKIVSVNDPAIDTESMERSRMSEYIRTRDIRIVAPFIRAGSKPTTFHIREVPRRLWSAVVGPTAGNETMRNERCFLAGVVRVENMHQWDGVVVTDWTPPFVLDSRGDSTGVMRDEALERFSPAEVDEVGQVIYEHSFLARRTRVSFLLPDSCVLPLAQRQFLRVDASPKSQPKSSDDPSSESDPATPVATATSSDRSVEPSADRTAATATEIPFQGG